MEKSSCGVGFLVSLKNEYTHKNLEEGLHALECMEHRGGVGPNLIGDGAGIMTTIPYELFNREAETFAVAFIFCPQDSERRKKSLEVFESTFWGYGLKVAGYREVPIDITVLSPEALKIMPYLIQAIIERPDHCRTLYSFERLLYQARQRTRTKEKENGIHKEFFFSSLSPRSIVYKALCRGPVLKEFYLDLKDTKFKTSFALFHRRFSTNTLSSWDKTQPFRLIAHNGEINTIEGNKAWAITREKDLGLKKDELITHEGNSDSGNLNGIAEGLRYRSSIPKLAETLAILIPPANKESSYYKFWSRGMEPWDGPAMIAFSDGKHIGARLDRNGFRPSRWQRTDDHFYLASEVGVFKADEKKIKARGALSSGESVMVHILKGTYSFLDAKDFPENKNVTFDPRVVHVDDYAPPKVDADILWKQKIFNFSKDEIDKIIFPMASKAMEPIGSMGDTASLAVLSNVPRSLYDFFYQHFAQVTNPPIDYIREKIVTDMKVFLGRKPNIFEAKDFIPLKPALELDGPVLSLGQMEFLSKHSEIDLSAVKIDITFHKNSTLEEFNSRLDAIREEAILALKNGFSLVILSDRNISEDMIPIPSLLALSYLNLGLNETGRRLRTSLLLEVGDVRNPHQMACLISYGASAICPYMAIETIMTSDDATLLDFFPLEREKRFIKAMKDGVLKIMAKRGISVLRSYQGSKLFTPIGLGQDVMDKFFKGEKSILGGYSLQTLLDLIKTNSKIIEGDLKNNFLFKEQSSLKSGEIHAMTSQRSRAIHKMLEETDLQKAFAHFKTITSDLDLKPILIRHLLDLVTAKSKKEVSSTEEILKTFGSGAMSFGAISAESQRDLILAFREIKGRSNSGEGGENPYYETDKITSNIKQIASGRFGVTAEYLVTGEEVQIKIAQGAKPGEGGQLMGVKVTEDIAKARFTTPGIDLISPAPQHDIYSIEDLKQLIYEIKELHSTLKVSVKLVSNENIGAIAVGVVKAGADIIQISGGDGGTGAASLLSMKHAGLPLEIGLLEVHRDLTKNGLREKVILRADGGFISGKDVVIAACLGADQFDFGKLLLVGQGCIMARVCEKNTCPTGIATQSPKFKAHYKGNPESVVKLLKCLALEVQEILGEMGVSSLKEIRGNNYRLKVNEKHLNVIKERNIDLTYFTHRDLDVDQTLDLYTEPRLPLNQTIIKDLLKTNSSVYKITNVDRAVPASLSGMYALKTAGLSSVELPEKTNLKFTGSAGQGFGVFNVKEIDIRLEGEANDSVGKGMSGGKITITTNLQNSHYVAEENTIIGNCALYGATGGTLLVHGKAGDRFAVRNSGASAIVEGVGLHACEYMSGGQVWILGETKGNLGAGMSGGVIYTHKKNLNNINTDYIVQVPLTAENQKSLRGMGETYLSETKSLTMKKLLEDNSFQDVVKFIPKTK